MPTEHFDFDTRPDRSGVGCAKWNRRTDAEKAANIVPMSIADMEFRCPPCVTQAMERATRHGYYGYTDADAPYYEAVRGWLARRHGWDVLPEWIVPQGGVVPALSVAVRTFTDPGDRVIIQSPGYTPFRMAVLENGREVVFNPLALGSDGFYRMDLVDLREKAKDPRTKMLMLCSPHNPVGRVWTEEELRDVAAICRENDLLIVSDEIHFDLALYGKHSVLCKAAPDIADSCLILTSPSKTFNLAGLQVANTIIPNETLRQRFKARMFADGYSNNSFFGYHAAIAAYNEGDAWLDALLQYVRENFIFFEHWLEQNMPMLRLMPVEGTYLAWVDFRAIGMTDAELERFVRGEAMLFLDEGTMFGDGGEGFMRFNLALPQGVLHEALDRLLIAAKNKKIV